MPAKRTTAAAQGIYKRHSRSCAAYSDRTARCRCSPTYIAVVWSRREQKKLKKSFPSLDAAKAWRADTEAGVRKGTRKAPTKRTLDDAVKEMLAGIKSGAIRTRDGSAYRSVTIRGYEDSLRLHIQPTLGGLRLGDITRDDVRRLVETWQAKDASGAAIRNRVMPLRVLYNRALDAGEVATSPLDRLRLPAAAKREVEPPSVDKTLAMLEPLPRDVRTLYALAMFAGLRLGEIRALRWEDVDLKGGLIRVRASLDTHTAARQAPKTKAGSRDVIIVEPLRRELDATRAPQTKMTDYVVPGNRPDVPFTPTNVRRKALNAWKHTDPPTPPLTPHEGRHVFASYLIDTGQSDVVIQRLMGHSDPATTRRIYAHLLDGGLEEARAKMDAYFARADTASRIHQLN
jgi:integrase